METKNELYGLIAQEKKHFHYFMFGATGTLFTYLSQRYQLNLSELTGFVELASLFSIFISLICSLRMSSLSIDRKEINYMILQLVEKEPQYYQYINKLGKEEVSKPARKEFILAKVRNMFLFLGVLLQIASTIINSNPKIIETLQVTFINP
ncbi:hypothetical protein [Aliivibrio fischeri]|uniref:hypothetical protein n=1 Tax=Aliivibrio fischeri TaxID=668 RepID=UPI00084C8FE4|nr:hypothetical protein [Aliivibrio fischeri]OED51061.1 hypothetical protein BEI47_10475 [Aliivibrio fischeri]